VDLKRALALIYITDNKENNKPCFAIKYDINMYILFFKQLTNAMNVKNTKL